MDTDHEPLFCIECFFSTRWRVQGKTETAVASCRRSPPVLVSERGEVVSRFPEVKPADWCGEFEASALVGADFSIEMLAISESAKKSLRELDVETLHELLEKTGEELLANQDIGEIAIGQIRAAVIAIGVVTQFPLLERKSTSVP